MNSPYCGSYFTVYTYMYQIIASYTLNLIMLYVNYTSVKLVGGWRIIGSQMLTVLGLRNPAKEGKQRSQVRKI